MVYGVRKTYVDERLPNGKIMVGRIKSYQNIDGTVHPIVKEVGANRMIDPVLHYIYTDLDTAVNVISSGKRKC